VLPRAWSARRLAALAVLACAPACAEVPPPPAEHGVAAARPGSVVAAADTPAAWVARLDDAQTRPEALRRLVQAYDDALTQDAGDRAGAHVKPLLDAVVAPLAQRCVALDLDAGSRVKLVKLLAETRDARAEACFAKTLADYQPDATEESVRDVCRAVVAGHLTGLAGPLLGAFEKVHASRPEAQRMYRDVYDAVVAVRDRSWEPRLVASLGRPVDAKDVKAATDEMFWQMTAAEVLGHLRSEGAVRPLLGVLLSPAKAAAHATAVMALLRIGAPAVAPATALLEGRDAALAAEGEAARRAAGETGPADVARVGVAAQVLGALGRSAGRAPLLHALATPDPLVRAVIARALPRLPADAGTLAAFRGVLEATPLSLAIPATRGSAREELAERAAELFDAGVVPWLVDDARRLKGDEGDVQAAREAAFVTVLKVARADQVGLLDALAGMGKRGQTPAQGFKKEIAATKALLAACGDRVDCWLEKLGEPAAQAPATQFQGIKSAAMVGVLGDAAARTRLVALLPRLTNQAVHFVALGAIERLTPRADAATVAALQQLLDEDVASGKPERAALAGPLRVVVLRLAGRE
jgi:hypothetical protein